MIEVEPFVEGRIGLLQLVREFWNLNLLSFVQVPRILRWPEWFMGMMIRDTQEEGLGKLAAFLGVSLFDPLGV